MFDFFKKRKEKEKLDNIKENASKIFNNTFLYKGAAKITIENSGSAEKSKKLLSGIRDKLSDDTKINGKSALMEFFNRIKKYPKVVEYVFEHAPIIYDDSLLENAKQIRKYLEEDKTLSPIYSKYRESLKKEFDKQVKKLRISYIYKFLDNFNKNYLIKKYEKEVKHFEKISKKLTEIKNEIIKFVVPVYDQPFGDVYFHISDCNCSISILRWFEMDFLVSALMYLVEDGILNGVLCEELCKDGKLDEYYKRYLKPDYDGLDNLVTGCFWQVFPNTLFSNSQDKADEATIKYVKENKLTLEKLIEKINKVLKLIANLKFDDINK